VLFYDRQITISTAGSRKATQWPPQKIYISEFWGRLKTPVRGIETLKEYLALPKSKQDEQKDVGGYIGGSLGKGYRRKECNVTGRDIITLDLDSIQPGMTRDTLLRIDALGCGYAVYSTRKHEEGKPRLRVLIPLNRTATADEYEPAARKLASIIGIELCDPSTFEASRLMYWPSCSADSQFVFQVGDKPFLDLDGILGMYTNWRNVAEWPEVPGAQQTHVKLAAKQGDPVSKTGIVGAFCKTYDVYRAMDTFLPGVYIPCDDSDDRLTFSGGSTVGGAVIYDNGNFIFSHHATDPAGGKLCNAFDLVRLHRFNSLDDDAKPDTPTNKLPSYTAMCELAVSDTYVAALLNQERYEKATQEFSTPLEDNANWMSGLKLNENGNPVKTSPNIVFILENDPLLKNKIRFDKFLQRIRVLDILPWKSPDPPRDWSDDDDAQLQVYLEGVFNIYSPGKLASALRVAAGNRAFHPVQDYLTALIWDEVPRLDTLFIDYLGAADTPYTRTVARKALTAAVARAMTPGCKFDNMLVLVGPQGRGKTTLLQKMGRGWFSNSLITFEGKEASEQVQGVWILEIGEMQAMNRSETNTVKNFISKTEDIFRAAYGHHTESHKRQCVFFGTTNTVDCLRDPTGGRRFWPIDIDQGKRKKDIFRDLDNEVDQIWAEAFVRWQLGETLYLSGELEKAAQEAQEAHRETDPLEGLISKFLDQLVPEDWQAWPISKRMLFWGGGSATENLKLVQRDCVCALEIWTECLGKNRGDLKQRDTRQINQILDRQEGWERSTPRPMGTDYGSQRGFVRKRQW
jgi:predicted P-loop ATPase